MRVRRCCALPKPGWSWRDPNWSWTAATAISRRARPTRCSDALNPVTQSGYAGLFRAVVAAIERAAVFQTVPDDTRAAMLAGRGKRVDRAFEAVECVRLAVHDDLKRLVVVVAAGFACGHDKHPG